MAYPGSPPRRARINRRRRSLRGVEPGPLLPRGLRRSASGMQQSPGLHISGAAGQPSDPQRSITDRVRSQIHRTRQLRHRGRGTGSRQQWICTHRPQRLGDCEKQRPSADPRTDTRCDGTADHRRRLQGPGWGRRNLLSRAANSSRARLGQASFAVTGSKFLANHVVHIRVVNDANLVTVLRYHLRFDRNHQPQINIPCVPGTKLSFSANDDREDKSDLTGTLWSNTAKVTAP